MSLTVSECLSPVSKMVNLCPTDARVYDFINEACQRLMWKGRNKSTYARFAVVATNAIIAWPREIETPEKVNTCDVQIAVRNGWYEFLESGPGLLDATTYLGAQCIDRGHSPLSSDLVAGEKLKIYTTIAGDANAVILVQGTDSTGTEIRTVPVSTYIAGRQLTLLSPSVTSPEEWLTVSGVQKPVLKGSLTVKAINTITSAERTIAIWHAEDTKPSFRRSIIPGLLVDGATSRVVTVIGKLRNIPVRVSTDWVIPDNLAAVKLMCRAIYLEESDRLNEAVAFEQLAKAKLDEQTLDFIGAANQPLGLNYGTTYGGAGVNPVM